MRTFGYSGICAIYVSLFKGVTNELTLNIRKVVKRVMLHEVLTNDIQNYLFIKVCVSASLMDGEK